MKIQKTFKANWKHFSGLSEIIKNDITGCISEHATEIKESEIKKRVILFGARRRYNRYYRKVSVLFQFDMLIKAAKSNIFANFIL